MTVYNRHLSGYIADLFAPQDEALQAILESIERNGLPEIQIKPEEGKFLQFLVCAIGATRVVEIGTLGGYSGLHIARGLPPDGKLITLEKNEYHARIARENFERAGVAGQVEVRVGEAMHLLKNLSAQGPFDFVFIDADKTAYNAYLDWTLENLAAGGVVAAHNTFRHGSVLDPEARDEATQAIRAFNRRVSHEPRLLSTIYPAGDGMLIAVKIH